MRSPVLYGYSLEPDWAITPSVVEQRLSGLQKERQDTLTKLQTIDGAVQDCQHWLEGLKLTMRGAGNIFGQKKR